jgi:uncharacterized protein YciI
VCADRPRKTASKAREAYAIGDNFSTYRGVTAIRTSRLDPNATSTNPGSESIMFVIELTYKADLTEIDTHMRAHVAFLNKYYASGTFLVSGRKVPREGGIILAVAESREQIETIVREDPFHQRGLAEFRVIEFRASQRAKNIDVLLEREPKR